MQKHEESKNIYTVISKAFFWAHKYHRTHEKKIFDIRHWNVDDISNSGAKGQVQHNAFYRLRQLRLVQKVSGSTYSFKLTKKGLAEFDGFKNEFLDDLL